MKIAIPTNDRITLAERTGRVKEFAIVEIIDGQIISSQFVTNLHEHHDHDENEEHGEHTHNELVESLQGIDLLVLKNIGKHLKDDLDKASIKYEKTNFSTISEIQDFYKK
jgi:predicted Fe-Mo cluster-binding NifX family protein